MNENCLKKKKVKKIIKLTKKIKNCLQRFYLIKHFSGLKSSLDAYAFELKDPHDADMNKYRKYTSMMSSNLFDTKANDKNIEDMIPSAAATHAILSRCKLTPLFEFNPSFFTVDSAFHVF